jgi:predicted O-methyltransferase YrrM
MKSRVTRNDFSIIAAATAVMIVASLAGWQLFGSAAVLAVVTVALAIALWAQFESMRRTSEQLTELRKNAFDDFRQVESLLSLFATLKPDLPLPPLRDHSMSPDLLRIAVEIMLERRPRVTVELGSGASTIFLAYCLKRIGSGKIISVDHDPIFAEKTRAMIGQHGLSDYAKVLSRPLEPLRMRGNEYVWYSIHPSDTEGPIDLLVIDGPPYHTHPLARYPALPVMLPYMTQNSVAILDDANRPEEQRIMELWRAEFPELSMEILETEKGALRIERSAPRSADGPARELGQDESAAHSRAHV